MSAIYDLVFILDLFILVQGIVGINVEDKAQQQPVPANHITRESVPTVKPGLSKGSGQVRSNSRMKRKKICHPFECRIFCLMNIQFFLVPHFLCHNDSLSKYSHSLPCSTSGYTLASLLQLFDLRLLSLFGVFTGFEHSSISVVVAKTKVKSQ